MKYNYLCTTQMWWSRRTNQRSQCMRLITTRGISMGIHRTFVWRSIAMQEKVWKKALRSWSKSKFVLSRWCKVGRSLKRNEDLRDATKISVELSRRLFHAIAAGICSVSHQSYWKYDYHDHFLDQVRIVLPATDTYFAQTVVETINISRKQ